MNFITLNGIRSDSVKGLLISELPPVVKPQQRTEIEEIDGRDGDIVTKLGYSAYDMTMLIGLHGDFDIDDVIRFFDSEGDAIFSNEPDKLYKYQILDDIEFERLIRFRKAKVSFHVQPFKYSAVERIKTINAETEDSFRVLNSGNTVARPRITITGSGTINLSLNNHQMFIINLGNEGYITIDTEEMNAYKGSVLKNRLVTGNYDNFALTLGMNVISWTGDVDAVSIEKYSRWI
jgi:predicted phage tail component-like protein